MPDSIRELVMKNIQATMEGITVANGYSNTLASVQRYRQSGQTTVNVPCVLIREAEEEAEDGPDPLITKHLLVLLHVITRQDDDTDLRSGDEVMNSLRADIEKALMGTRSRGGYAIDTKHPSSIEMEVEEGQPALETVLQFEVIYRNRYQDPTAAT